MSYFHLKTFVHNQFALVRCYSKAYGNGPDMMGCGPWCGAFRYHNTHKYVSWSQYNLFLKAKNAVLSYLTGTGSASKEPRRHYLCVCMEHTIGNNHRSHRRMLSVELPNILTGPSPNSHYYFPTFQQCSSLKKSGNPWPMA